MNIFNRINAFFNYSKVGEDQYGNGYYKSVKEDSNTGEHKRIVMYSGIAEPTKVPPSWHAWLHCLTAEAPASGNISHTYPWQKDHMPNLTGTKMAISPSEHVIYGKNRPKVSSDYQAWNPNSTEELNYEQ